MNTTGTAFTSSNEQTTRKVCSKEKRREYESKTVQYGSQREMNHQTFAEILPRKVIIRVYNSITCARLPEFPKTAGQVKLKEYYVKMNFFLISWKLGKRNLYLMVVSFSKDTTTQNCDYQVKSELGNTG